MNLYDRYTAELQADDASGSYRVLPPAVDRSVVNLSSNDYLGLNEDENLMSVFMSEYQLDTRSMSSCSSRLLTGNHNEYVKLEAALETLYPERRALVYPSGYHVNIGVLPTVAAKRDLIVADKLVHASIIDGIRLSPATLMRFNHNNINHLQSILEKHRQEFDNCFIVAESIYSMDGDVAKLSEIVELKHRFNCMLYVDEAHAFGVRGERGEGVCSELSLLPDVDFLVATLGKAAASMGSFVMVNEVMHNYLVNHSRSMIYTTALPPVNVAWSRFVIRHFAGMQSEREQLKQLSSRFAQSIGTQAETHIVPFMIGSNSSAIGLSAFLRDNGFYVLPIRHPTVPKGTARLRFSLKANMHFDDIRPIGELIRTYINTHRNDFSMAATH